MLSILMSLSLWLQCHFLNSWSLILSIISLLADASAPAINLEASLMSPLNPETSNSFMGSADL